jgi:hypothetical protein
MLCDLPNLVLLTFGMTTTVTIWTRRAHGNLYIIACLAITRRAESGGTGREFEMKDRLLLELNRHDGLSRSLKEADRITKRATIKLLLLKAHLHTGESLAKAVCLTFDS